MNRTLPTALIRGVLTVLMVAATSGPCLAGPLTNARFALHATEVFVPSKTNPTPCSATPTDQGIPCLSFNLYRPAPAAATVFLIAVQLNTGILGASCGVSYTGGPGVGINPTLVTWTGCSNGLEFPNGPPGGQEWPAPGGGIRVTWVTCQLEEFASDGQAEIGSFYVYAYDSELFTLTPNNNLASGPELAFSACGGSTDDLLDYFPNLEQWLVGTIAFGGAAGANNPCWGIPLPVHATTWGRVKTMYRSDPGSPTRPD